MPDQVHRRETAPPPRDVSRKKTHIHLRNVKISKQSAYLTARAQGEEGGGVAPSTSYNLTTTCVTDRSVDHPARGGKWRNMENRGGFGGNQLGNWLGFGLRGGEGERGGFSRGFTTSMVLN